MQPPADWVSKTDIAVAVGVTDNESRRKFERNFRNWRLRFPKLFPKLYNGLPVPLYRRRGGKIGNQSVYPPAFIERVHRLQRQADDFELWIWHDHPHEDVVRWCRERIRKIAAEISKHDENEAVKVAISKPEKHNDPRRRIFRRLIWKSRLWVGLTVWAVFVGSGRVLLQSIFDPGSSSAEALAKLMGLPVDTVRRGLDGSGIEDYCIARLLAVLDKPTPSELVRVRTDLRTWSRAGERRDLVGFAMSRMWRRKDVRAMLLPGLILLRRSPDHQLGLASALRLPAES